MVEPASVAIPATASRFSDPKEQAAIAHRRAAIYDDKVGPGTTWGLALSGGGIRSATFCLGVLQALAKASFTLADGHIQKASNPLLARFDFLSSVSGGGYTGGFYSALFRSRPDQAVDEKKAAEAAYAALATDPPGRMGNISNQNSVDRPLRWLRENGRYLAPNNTGDLLYDIAIAIRNLCAVHYVIGITLLTLFLFMFAFRYGSINLPGEFSNFSTLIEIQSQPDNARCHGSIWWSPWFVMTGIWMVVGVIPLGIAYWFEQDKPQTFFANIFRAWVAGALLLSVGMYTSTVVRPSLPAAVSIGNVMLLFNVLLGTSLLVYAIIKIRNVNNVRIFRAKITGLLSQALIVALVLVSLAITETAGQTLYLWILTAPENQITVYYIAALVPSLIAAIRQFAPILAQPDKNGLLAKLPLNAILGVIGIVLLLLLVVSWHALATAIFFRGVVPEVAANQALISTAFDMRLLDASAWWKLHTFYPWAAIVFCVIATIASGYFLGFVNLSSLQMMYSARLTRAYLGASNVARFAEKSTQRDVTEPHKHDDFPSSKYYENNHLGPAHIINVTINATTGSGDQLTQRDRQGIPMALTPAGVTVNGERWTNGAEMSIGQWIGISGAAFSTGIGRGTGLGTALVFGLTNIRLGWWWNSGQASSKGVKFPWRNQAYLVRELRARFLGKDGSHWYLSDGGHYENTGVFELLRRRVAFIVCCDCGADPAYNFDDLANLMRLARIDFGAEFELINPAAAPVFAGRADDIKQYFAEHESDLNVSPQGMDYKCALLYRVTYAFGGANEQSYLLVLKPRIIKDAPLDLLEYQTKQIDFPQQTTFDQFFDEAQWESYRKLGVLIGSRIFPA